LKLAIEVLPHAEVPGQLTVQIINWGDNYLNKYNPLRIILLCKDGSPEKASPQFVKLIVLLFNELRIPDQALIMKEPASSIFAGADAQEAPLVHSYAGGVCRSGE